MPKNKKGILMETFMGKWTVLLQLNMIHCFPIAINNDSLYPVLLNSRGTSFLGETLDINVFILHSLRADMYAHPWPTADIGRSKSEDSWNLFSHMPFFWPCLTLKSQNMMNGICLYLSSHQAASPSSERTEYPTSTTASSAQTVSKASRDFLLLWHRMKRLPWRKKM